MKVNLFEKIGDSSLATTSDVATFRNMTWRATLALTVTSLAAFEVAYETAWGSPAVVVYLGCLFALAWVKSTRLACYLGMLIGTVLAALQLTFMFDIFGPAAVGLWMILGVWTGLFLLLSRIVVARWPVWGAIWIPILWVAVEYFRSELYYLRFSWGIPAWAVGNGPWKIGLSCGVYGMSGLVMAAFVVFRHAKNWRVLAAGVGLAIVFTWQSGDLIYSETAGGPTGPKLVGIQLESVTPEVVLASLMQAGSEHPDADMFVFSEYTFGGPIPDEIREWCDNNDKFLVAGGKQPVDEEGAFVNTVYVVGPTGEVEFQQGKSVPIQFFNDGLPAPQQQVWNSPWGKIGFAICYDLSYSRVVDRLVERGAEALIVPAVDAQDWGAHEHLLHARIAPARSYEYRIPIFRLASSGISQLVDATGRELERSSFPGQGEKIVGRLPMGSRCRLPIDRYLVIPAVLATAALLFWLAMKDLEGYWEKLVSRRMYVRS